MSESHLTKEEKRNLVHEKQKELDALKHELEEEDIAEKAFDQPLDNSYEELLKQEPWTLSEKIQDITNFKLDFIKSTPNEQLGHLLKFFGGNSLTQKKSTLVHFLNQFPEYKTCDPDKMHERFVLLRERGKQAFRENNDHNGFYKFCADIGFIF